jgi:hypothetical protein
MVTLLNAAFRDLKPFKSRKPLITLMMEAVSTTETSVYFYKTTKCSVSEGCYLVVKYLVYSKKYGTQQSPWWCSG